HSASHGTRGGSAGVEPTPVAARGFYGRHPWTPDERAGIAEFQQHQLADGATKERAGVGQNLALAAEVEHES
ncbi:MAG: hypothetical protein M3322_06330, partial [Actinomycetota bacterium]|nr:hypothetical protein [Actinomycetota bacterium]